MSDESLNGDGGAEEEVRPEGVCRGFTAKGAPCRSATVGVDGLCRQHSKIEDVNEWRLDEETASSLAGDPLAWIEADDPRRLRHPDEWTTPNAAAGHTLCGPRCQGLTAQKERCKAAASSAVEGRVFCGQHNPEKAKAEGAKLKRRGGSLRDRLRARADDSYDDLEDELLGLAQSAMTTKTVTCRGCKRRTVVEVADASVRLRAIEAILDRVGAAKPTAAAKNDDQFEGRSSTLEEIQQMSTTDLVRYYDWLLARDADALERMIQAKRDYAATRAEYGSSKVVQMGFRSGSDDRTLRRLYAELHAMFGSDTIAA